MRICVSEELQYIKDELKKRGYEVTSKNGIVCDAIICNLKNGGLVNLNNIKREGTLIIDSGRKTIEEIEYILNNRVYNNLF